MKICAVLVLFALFSIESFSQINPDSFLINDLPFFSQSFQIRKVFGQPEDSFKLNYECGGLSEDWQGEEFWCLKYNGLRFAGNSGSGYSMEKLVFSEAANLNLSFYGECISDFTTTEDLKQMLFTLFKHDFIILPDNGTIIEFSDGDHGLVFNFKNNRLVSLEYYSPC